MTRSRRTALLILLLAPLSGHHHAVSALPETHLSSLSTTRPLPPDYAIHEDGSVNLRVCFNWSCSRRQRLDFSASDLETVRQQMASCPDAGQHDRLQRLRIGIWQMERLAEKYLPLLANDEAVNDRDQEREGRMDCVDNASNTTTYLHVLQDLGLMQGWVLEEPAVRDLLLIELVHWTAVVRDSESGESWSVDSWFRPNGHLPFVMPLADWQRRQYGWLAPLDTLNPYPTYTHQLCSA